MSNVPLEEHLAALRENGAAAGAATVAFFSSLGKAIGESSLVQSIKKVASQPALSGTQGNSGIGNSAGVGSSVNGTGLGIAAAADGVLSSLRQGLMPKGNLIRPSEWLSGRGNNNQAMTTFNAKGKEGTKAD